MNPDDEIAAKVLAAIAALPLEDQPPAILALIGGALKEMPPEAIRDLRIEIVANFPAEVGIVGSTLELIDGHLALRELGAGEWR